MVHGQAYHAVGHLCGLREIGGIGTFKAAISGELADEGIEITTSPYTLLFHLDVEFIARHTVFLGVYEYGEIAIIMAYARHIVPERDTCHGT